MVNEKIRELHCDQLDLNEDDVTMSSNLQDDLGADSLDMVDLVMTIEDEFELDVDDENVEGIKTVGDIVHYIEENK